MTILTVTARGQVTFRKDVLHHLGIGPGDKIALDKLPDGRVALRAAKPAGTIDGFLGLLAGKSERQASLDDLNEAAAAGWAGHAMRITADTNILIRAVVRDDISQATVAAKLLQDAEIIAVPLPCLCEFVWVLRRVYGFGQSDIRAALQALLDAGNVAVNRPAVDAGLQMLDAGGDFADGLIAFEGRWLGGETFVSFDKQAVDLLERQGQAARVPG